MTGWGAVRHFDSLLGLKQIEVLKRHPSYCFLEEDEENKICAAGTKQEGLKDNDDVFNFV